MMSDGLALPISEWLQTLKLEQYNDIFEKNDLHTVSDLRAFSDTALSKIGVLLPGHRKRILAFLQKSLSQDLPVEEDAGERPVPMKRNIFHRNLSPSEQEIPPLTQNPLIPFESSGHEGTPHARPPIPPRIGCVPPVKFSATPSSAASQFRLPGLMPLKEPPSSTIADPPLCPARVSPPADDSRDTDGDTDETPRLVAPPLPAKRHRIESKSASRIPPPIPVRPPTIPPRIITPLVPQSPPAVEEPRAIDNRQNLCPSAVPKPLPRLPVSVPDLATKPVLPAPREGQQKQEEMEHTLGNLYELTGEIDGVVLTGFRSMKFSSDDDLLEIESDDYEDVPSIYLSDSDLSTRKSSGSLSSGISSSHSGVMDETESSSHSPVIKAGWLDKNPPQGSYIYQKRWVKLDPDYLRYSDNDKDMYSKRFIKTRSISRVTSSGDQKFEVITSNRNFVFRSESDADRNEWVRALQQVLEERRTRLSLTQPAACTPETVDKFGLLEMKGCKPKLFVVVAADKVYLYKNTEDYSHGVGITSIDMNVGNVKDTDRKSFDLTTPYKTFSFSAESEAEKGEWIEAMEQSVAEALSNLEVARKIWLVEANQHCAECDSPSPDWASINLSVVICKKCAGEHRSLGPSISKVRSLKMDKKVWTEELIQLFQKIGNEVSNKFWAANVPPSEAIHAKSSAEDRKRFVLAKYREGKYRRYHQLFGDQNELNKALCAAVTTSDLTETQALLFCGADVGCSSGDPLFPHPLELAEQAGQRLQMEFLLHNRTSEIPRPDLGNHMEKQYYVTRPSITHNGFLYKTASTNKPITERKPREEFSRRWCVLNDNVLGYYESDRSSVPNREIKMEEIVCVAVSPLETHGFENTFEVYTESERLYLFGVDSPGEAKEWVKSIAKCFLPPTAEDLLNHDFERIGRLQYKGRRSLEPVEGWFCLCDNTLYAYFEDSETEEAIHLKKLSELSIRGEKEALVLVEKGRRIYILGERKLDFSGWVTAVQKAGSTSEDTLSGQQLTDSDVPVLVHKCIGYITTFGLGSEGIYRKSGQNSKTTSLLEALRKDARSVIFKEEEHEVDSVSNTLKRFFRDIGEGIFTKYYHDWLNVTATEDESVRIRQYQELLEILPPVNRATLNALISHLYFIQYFADVNQMNVHNLAIVFGPTIFQTDGQNFKPGRVVEDLINYYVNIFNVDEQELKKQLNINTTIMKIRNESKTGTSGAGEFICTVYLEEKMTRFEQIVQIPVTMTAEELTVKVLVRRKIPVEDGEYWSCFEVDESEELERPLHFSEKDLPIYNSQNTGSFLIIKKHAHMDSMLRYMASHPGDTKHGMMKFREGKSLQVFGGSFHDRYFMLNSTTLRMYKEVRSHKPEKEWPVKNLKLYLGIKKKIRPATRWGFTVIYTNEKREKNPWYLGCETLAEMREWFATFSFVQRGILWPTEPLKVRAPRAQQDSRFGNMSLIPLRGTENEMRRSVAAFSTDPLTLLGNV